MAHISAFPMERISRLRSDGLDGWALVAARYREDAPARHFILALLALNLALIALPIVLEFMERAGLIAAVSRPMLHPTVDGSVPELLNYAQTLLCALALGLAAWRRRSLMALAWAFVFSFVLADDALQYHETVGAWLAQAWSLPEIAGLRSVDLGELLAWGFAGLVAAALLVAAFRTSSGADRGIGLVILAIFAGLVVFGIGVDMLHVAIPSPVVMVLEDGGEMITIALATSVSLLWARSGRAARPASG